MRLNASQVPRAPSVPFQAASGARGPLKQGRAGQVEEAYAWPAWAEEDARRARENATRHMTDAEREREGVVSTSAYTFIPSSAVARRPARVLRRGLR